MITISFSLKKAPTCHPDAGGICRIREMWSNGLLLKGGVSFYNLAIVLLSGRSLTAAAVRDDSSISAFPALMKQPPHLVIAIFNYFEFLNRITQSR